MNRRTFLKATATTPLIASPVTATQEGSETVENVSNGYYAALPDSDQERAETVTECANALCEGKELISEELLDAVLNGTLDGQEVIRRIRFGVRILNERDVTHAIDESMIQPFEDNAGNLTRYIPLVGSFNHLCETACGVDPNHQESGEKFLRAALAFGIEVALWSVGAPYRIAWRGTRFVSNRTFLRLSNKGCNGCIALAMSELHYAIRGTIYGQGITADRFEYVWGEIQNLRDFAEKEDMDVQLEFSREEIQRQIESSNYSGGAGPLPQENESPLDRYLPDPSDISFPDIEISNPLGDIDLPNPSDLLK